MKTRAAVLREIGQPWSVEEIELGDPQAGEILVKTLAAGMCHSDEHAHDGTECVCCVDLPDASFAVALTYQHVGK